MSTLSTSNGPTWALEVIVVVVVAALEPEAAVVVHAGHVAGVVVAAEHVARRDGIAVVDGDSPIRRSGSQRTTTLAASPVATG